MRDLSSDDLRGPFESVAQLSKPVRAKLEDAGAHFREDEEPTQPGPTQWAAVELDNGVQYLLVHHYGHPESFIDLRAEIGAGTPQQLAQAFANEFGIAAAEVTWTATAWP